MGAVGPAIVDVAVVEYWRRRSVFGGNRRRVTVSGCSQGFTQQSNFCWIAVECQFE